MPILALNGCPPEPLGNYNSSYGHSADVRMQLLLNGHVLPIAQLGLDFLLLDQPVDHPAGLADILLKVDNYVKRWTVRLPNGVCAGQKHVLIAKA
jgi:hypothetical protein